MRCMDQSELVQCEATWTLGVLPALGVAVTQTLPARWCWIIKTQESHIDPSKRAGT